MGEVEVTEEMLRAGFSAYTLWEGLGGGPEWGDKREMFRAVYRAMYCVQANSYSGQQNSGYSFGVDEYHDSIQ